MTSSATRPGKANLPSGASCSSPSPLLFPLVPPSFPHSPLSFFPSFFLSSYLICFSFDLHSYIFPCVNPLLLDPFSCRHLCVFFSYLFFLQPSLLNLRPTTIPPGVQRWSLPCFRLQKHSCFLFFFAGKSGFSQTTTHTGQYNSCETKFQQNKPTFNSRHQFCVCVLT